MTGRLLVYTDQEISDEWHRRFGVSLPLPDGVAQAPMDREKVAKIFAYIWHGDLGEGQGFLSKADAFLTYPVPSTTLGGAT